MGFSNPLKTGIVGFGLFLLLLSPFFFAFGQDAPPPADLEISLYSAPVITGFKPGPAEVVISADGSAVLTRGENPEAAKTITLPDGALARIWAALEKNQFFTLKPRYEDPGVLDGDWAQISITANGQTYRVKTINIKVTAFDNISLAINAELPEGERIKYNALLGADYNEVER